MSGRRSFVCCAPHKDFPARNPCSFLGWPPLCERRETMPGQPAQSPSTQYCAIGLLWCMRGNGVLLEY